MQIKKLFVLSLMISTTLLSANDIYKLAYNKENNCTLTKNNKKIPLFDPRFKKQKPRSSYTCTAIQKEQYNDCKRVDYKNTSAQMIAFGNYAYTNLVLAFQNPSKSVKSSLTVECTKKLPKKNK